MPITFTHAKNKSHLSVLIFGEPGSRAAALALDFPNPVAVDATNTLDAFGEGLKARLLRSYKPSAITELIQKLARGDEKADTFVIDGLSRVLDEIQVTSEGSNGRYYSAVRDNLYRITDPARALPMHVVFTCRAKDSWAKTGDIVGGHMVGPEDRIVTGSEPDIDRAIPYDVDVVLEMIVDNAGSHYARVSSSNIAGLQNGMVIENPTAAKILELAKLTPTEPPKPIDYDAIDETHAAYGTNEHIQHLNNLLNTHESRADGAKLSVRDRTTSWKIWNGQGGLNRDMRLKIVSAYKAALATAPPTAKMNSAPEVPAGTTAGNSNDEAQQIEHGVSNNDLMALFKERNALVKPPFDRITTYIREHVKREHVQTPDDVTLEDRLATRAALVAEIDAKQGGGKPATSQPEASAEAAVEAATGIVAGAKETVAQPETPAKSRGRVIETKPSHRD